MFTIITKKNVFYLSLKHQFIWSKNQLEQLEIENYQRLATNEKLDRDECPQYYQNEKVQKNK